MEFGSVQPEEHDGVETELFVGNLPWTTDENTLQDRFCVYGDVNFVKVLYNHEGRSKGIAFIKMASSQGAHAAIAAENGADCGGRALRVNLSSDKSKVEAPRAPFAD